MWREWKRVLVSQIVIALTRGARACVRDSRSNKHSRASSFTRILLLVSVSMATASPPSIIRELSHPLHLGVINSPPVTHDKQGTDVEARFVHLQDDGDDDHHHQQNNNTNTNQPCGRCTPAMN